MVFCCCFGKRAGPAVEEAKMDNITIHDQKLCYVVDSGSDEKYCAVEDILTFLQNNFNSHKTIFSPMNKNVKGILKKVKKNKKIRRYNYVRINNPKSGKRTEFCPLSTFLPLINVADLNSTEVTSLYILLLGRLDASPPPFPTASRTQAWSDGQPKKFHAENKDIEMESVVAFSDIGSPSKETGIKQEILALDSFKGVDSTCKTPKASEERNNELTTNNDGKKNKKKAKNRLKRIVKMNVKELENNFRVISERFEKLIDENKSVLSSPRPLDNKENNSTDANGSGKEKDAKEIELEQQAKFLADRRAKRMSNKNKIVELIEGTEKLTYAMPRWRHEMLGNLNPRPEYILRGKKLFRLIARIVLHFYVKPMLNVRQKKFQDRYNLMKEFSRSTKLFFDICCGWMGKLMYIPVTSILQVACFHIICCAFSQCHDCSG